MVYGKKHLAKVKICGEKLATLVEGIFPSELRELHGTREKYQLFTQLGMDTHTDFHKRFYQKIDGGWPEFQEEYTRLIREVVLPHLGLEEALVQTTPNLRCHLPDNVAVVVKHHDSDEAHRHPKGEINFIYALTDMYDTNTFLVEKMPRSGDFVRMEMKRGELTSFNGNLCDHYNEINKTGVTRCSFDFRVLPLNYYDETYEKKSVTKEMKYVEGGYYTRFTAVPKPGARDIWDMEKQKFKGVMEKYGVQDAWGVVDIFEKRMAEYAGSKYAVTVDNCTNALFLSLKYLGAAGKVIIPARTWVSVPCTIRNAGCEVEFKDMEWSGAYQLHPYPIYDGAVRMKRGMYKKGTFHCLSFHIRKHIPIGKGGMILTDSEEAYKWFRTVRYSGRTIAPDGVNYVLYKEDRIETTGWNMYMTPEQAARGLDLLERIGDDNPDQESSGTCKDLRDFKCYQ